MTKSIGPILFLLCLSASLPASADVAAAWDWRDVDGVDYLSPARSTGLCGASYLFAPVAMVEARVRIAAVRRGVALPDPDYSEQYILACGSGWYGDFDCDGGFCGDILTHFHEIGAPSEDCMAYQANDAACPTLCPDTGETPVLQRPVDEHSQYYPYPADAVLMQEIQDNGPMVTTLDYYADLDSYASGVYEHVTGSLHGSTAVLLVGWGDDGGTPYWICRNVWGTGWGDGGDFLVARNSARANCDFGEWAWSCTIDAEYVSNETMTFGRLKSLYR